MQVSVTEDCFDVVQVLPSETVKDNPEFPKIYVSVDVVCSQSYATNINPTFTVQVTCLNIHDCSLQSWKLLKTFKRFMELYEMLRKEFPEETETMDEPKYPLCSEETPARRKFLNFTYKCKRYHNKINTITEQKITCMKVKMHSTIRLFVKQLLTAEILIFSPLLCNFFGIDQNLRTIRLYSGNQLREEIESNTELQLRRTVHYHERQLEKQQEDLSKFLNSSEYDGQAASLEILGEIKTSVEEISILLRASRLNLEVYLNSPSRNLGIEIPEPESLPTGLCRRQAALVLELAESPSKLSASLLFPAPKDNENISRTERNSGLLNLSLLQTDSVLKALESETHIGHSLCDELEELLRWLEISMGHQNDTHIQRFCMAVKKKLEEVEAESEDPSEYRDDLLWRARIMIDQCV